MLVKERLDVDLVLCKACSYHICVMGDKVLCAFNIDREEKDIRTSSNGYQAVDGCPKENS